MSDKYRKLYIIMSMSACWKRNARIILITGTMIIQKSFGLFEQIYKNILRRDTVWQRQVFLKPVLIHYLLTHAFAVMVV